MRGPKFSRLQSTVQLTRIRFSTEFVLLMAVCVGVMASLAIGSASAQGPSSRRQAKSSDLLTIDIVNTRSEEADAAGMEEDALASVKKLYRQASAELEAAKLASQQTAKFEQMSKTAAVEIEAAKARSYPKDAAKDYIVPDDASIAEIETELRKRQAELDTARQKQTELAAEPARRQSRLVEIPGQLKDVRLRLDNIKGQLEAPSISGESAAVAQARTTGLVAERQHLEQEIDALQAEEAAYAATADLIVVSGETMTREARRLTDITAKLQQRLAERREQELSKLASESLKKVRETFVELKPYAEVNADLAGRLEEVSRKLNTANKLSQAVASEQQKVVTGLETTRERVGTGRLSDTMGVMLRQKKTKQAEIREKYRPDVTAHETMRNVQAERFILEDQKQELLDPEEMANQLLADHVESAGVSTKDSITRERANELLKPLTDLLQARKDLLTRLTQLNDDLFVALYDLEAKQTQLQDSSNKYTALINETIFWIRSAPVIGTGERLDYQAAVAWILAPKNWVATGNAITRSVTSRLPTALPLLAVVILLLTFRPRLKNGISAAAKLAEKRSARNFSPTVSAFVQTVLLSMLWPAVLFATGSLLNMEPGTSEFVRSLGPALIRVSLAIWPLEFLRQVCRPKGLAEAHFEWLPRSRKSVKTNLRWFVPVAAVLVTLILTLQNQSHDGWSISLGRLALVVLLALATFVLFRLFRPGGTWFVAHDISEDSPWFLQFGYLRFLLMMGMMVALLAFALAGYYYTSVELTTVWSRTLSLAFVLYVLYSIALRLLLVRRRRLRYDQLVEQRENSRKAATEVTESSSEAMAEAMSIELKTETGLDITDVSRQARELTGVIFGLLAIFLGWGIWQDILPATGLFDYGLWPAVTGDNGKNIEWVTVRDLLTSLMLFTLTFLGVRNIPGMLELILLKQLPLDAGSRYAISTIVRYIITVFGVILALSYLKIPWDKYSWLVAAISVGLGFGLQEIVANFVSGLILLLERPVRVGDVVTIDGTTGIVSRIKMRATTVTNWDNQELVVPNKDLITGKLINWTLSSVINRIALNVGVEYGTDPTRVREIIMKVAAQNSDLLKDPEPMVTFEEFGDSSLNFKLRCCITAIAKRFMIIHDLNTAIYKGLTEAGIGIPFPQRDVNMKLPAGVRITNEDRAEK